MIKACVIGWPISHSRSPLIHGYWLKQHRIDGSYTRQPVEPEALAARAGADVVIVEAVRTPVGKFLGGLAPVTAGELGAVILRGLVERTGIDPLRIDDVVFAQGYGNGEAPCIARWSALAAGLPISVPGYQLDRRCGSGLQSVIDAAMMVQTGAADVVVAGGVESMSNVEHYTTELRKGVRAGNLTLHDRLTRGRVMSQPIERYGVISGMIETAENLAKDWNISREACDISQFWQNLQ